MINRYGLDQAIIELIKGNEPIIFIALQYGYQSQQTFTRALKSYIGMNPGEVR